MGHLYFQIKAKFNDVSMDHSSQTTNYSTYSYFNFEFLLPLPSSCYCFASFLFINQTIFAAIYHYYCHAFLYRLYSPHYFTCALIPYSLLFVQNYIKNFEIH